MTLQIMSVCYLLLSGIFVPGIFGLKETWGFKRYTKYEPGEMNLILTTSHGGHLNPSTQINGESWQNREYGCKGSDGKCIWSQSCGLKSTDCLAQKANDLFTLEIARDIADGIKAITGLRPHVVYNLLRRNKLDANREIHEATFNVPDAIIAHQDYNNFINKARSAINGRGLHLDIHSNREAIPGAQIMKLGYLVSADNLNSGNYSKDVTSIRSLGKHWCESDNTCFKNFICGNRSLGHFMNQEGLQAVPSPQNKKATADLGHYYIGTYTLSRYGSRNGGDIDAIQMEFPAELRLRWGDDDDTKHAVVRAILSFYKLNYTT